MTGQGYPIEKLHAYVDGELDGAKAAALLRELPGNPALACTVAELTALKSAVQQACADSPCRAPDLDQLFADHDKKIEYANVPQNRGRAGKWGWACAAAIAAVFVGALFLGWYSQAGRENDRLVAEAITLHHAWLQQPAQTAQSGRAQLASFQQLSPNIYVPDLAASKLRIARVAPFGAGAVHVGYVGTHECHLSLFIQPIEQFKPLALHEDRVGDSRVFTWRANRLDYVLLAVGMDQTRLRLIAEDVFSATNLMQPFDRQTQMALRLNRQKSQPCAA